MTPDLSPDVVHIVGVHDPNNVTEFVGPTPPMMEPIQVLRFLQNRNISLQSNSP